MYIVHRLTCAIRLILAASLLGACSIGAVRDGPPSVGAPAPDFSLPVLQGGDVQLSAHKGSVIVVNFWASWCGPCVEETPRLVRWYETYQDSGLLVLGVDVLHRDSREAVEAFVQEYNVSYPVPLDEDGVVTQRWLAQQLPRSYVIDREGVVRFARIGELTERDLQTEILPLLEAQ